jgi:hypothetical protein
MMITFFLVLAAVLMSVGLWWLAKGRAVPASLLENPAAHFRYVDVEAFRNLIDPAEEEYLRQRLAAADFRRIQRERLRAAVDYVFGAAHNAALLVRVAEAAQQSPDPATVSAAGKLLESAIQLRLNAFNAVVRLYLGMVLPASRSSSIAMVERYESLTRQVVMLGLQTPVPGISSTALIQQ